MSRFHQLMRLSAFCAVLCAYAPSVIGAAGVETTANALESTITEAEAAAAETTSTTTTTATVAYNQKLPVKIYYETLCPDSVRFIRNQLYYSMINNNRLPYTDLKFIPYGKVAAWTDPFTRITKLYCQHGTTECELNALHACIVENNNVEEQMKMVNCLMNGYSTNVDECASQLEINISDAKHCKATRETSEILQKYGLQTDAIDITFVPSIAIDGVFNPWKQRRILNNFDNVFCSKYKTKYNVTLDNCNI